MNCHGGNKDQQNDHGHKSHFKHMLMMVLCCAVPIAIILLLPVAGIDNALLKKLLSYSMLLICPLMHVMMIVPLFKKDKKKDDGTPTQQISE